MEEHHDHDDLQRGVHRDDGGSWGEQHVWDRGQCFYGCSGYLPCRRHKVPTLENVTCLHLKCSPSSAGSSLCSTSRTRCTWRTGSRARQVRPASFSLSFHDFSSHCCLFHYFSWDRRLFQYYHQYFQARRACVSPRTGQASPTSSLAWPPPSGLTGAVRLEYWPGEKKLMLQPVGGANPLELN